MIGLWWARMLIALALGVAPNTRESPAVVVSVEVDSDLRERTDVSELEHHIVRELRTRGLPAAVGALGPFPTSDEAIATSRLAPGSIAVWVDIRPGVVTRIAVAGTERDVVIRSSHREALGAHFASQLALLVAEPVEALLEQPEPTPPPAPIVDEAPPPAPRARTQFAVLGAGVAVAWPVLEQTPVAMADVRIGYVPHRRVSLFATSRLPMHAHRTRSPGGRVRTLPFVVGLLAALDLLSRRAPVSFDVEGGFNAVALRVVADPEQGRVGRSTWAWMGAATGGVRLRWPVHERVDLTAGGSILAPFNPVTLRAEGAPAQRWGPFWISAALAVQGRL